VPGVREETILRYKVNGSAEMQRRDDRYSIGASPQRCTTLRGEPAREHGPGIVGDSGERSDAHPV
jgi:hypothetical protein